MKQYTIYQCRVCGNESKDPDIIHLCEAQHMGLRTLDEYKTYLALRKKAEDAGLQVGLASNPQTRQKFDEACKNIADFETEHQMRNTMLTEPMSAFEILDRWAKYSNFDPEQHKFNLLSNEYRYHTATKNIVRFIDYDPTGCLAVIYARSIFLATLNEAKANVIALMENPDGLKDEHDMYRLFNSKSVQLVEQQILDAINKLVIQITGNQMIGQRDLEAEHTALINSITAVVEQLSKCRVDLFLRGGNIEPIRRYSTHIHIFEKLSECLFALEQAEDGLYLCYINNAGTADGYFGFFIKSNGSILAINERIDEGYPGQHKCSRNGRWSEEKKFDLFPYGYIFDFSEHDYKGYASKHIINEDRLAFMKLSPGAYMPLILAMVLINNKYTNFDVTSVPIKYIDSMMEVNLRLDPSKPPECQALVVPQNSAIAKVNRNLTLELNSKNILDNSFVQRFDDKNRPYDERGEFPTKQNIFVELYGEGWQLDTSVLLEANQHLKALPPPQEKDGIDRTPNCEFVGTEGRMEVIAYKQAREQLAAYIRNKMLEEYLAFGGRKAVQNWWDKLIQNNKDTLMRRCVYKMDLTETGIEHNSPSPEWINIKESDYRYINFVEQTNGRVESTGWYIMQHYPFNQPHALDKYGREDGMYLCPITGNKASIFFMFVFENWHELEACFGADNIPKIVKGWQKRRMGFGNSILRATDPCSEIGTVFEDYEKKHNRRLWTKQDWQNEHNRSWNDQELFIPDTAIDESTLFDFRFAIGFSKRGFAKLRKEVEAWEEKQKQLEETKEGGN